MDAGSRKWLGLCAVGVAALAAHLLLFSGLDWMWPQRAVATRSAAVQVRLVEPDVVPVQASIEAPMRAVVPAAAVKPVVAKVVKPAAIAPRPVPAATLPEEPIAAVTPASPAAPAMLPAADAAIPRYRTQMPPPIALRYVMQRGGLRGTGELTWKPSGDRYELRLEGSVAGLSVLTQVSSGGFDAAGVAPLRFTDQRLRRGTRATNFQRGAGKITFSGPSVEFPLHQGTQDRLSWMVQLASIVAAEPSLREIGAKVVMNVVGSNGDLSVWAFDCAGLEPVEAGVGTISALKFVREPREPYDTQVHVWVDPARHFLPVRAMQKSGSGDEAFELRLQSVDNNP